MKKNFAIEQMLLQPLAIDVAFGLSEYYRYVSEAKSGSIDKDFYKARQEALKPRLYCSGKLIEHDSSLTEVKNNRIAVLNLMGTMRSSDGLSSLGIDHLCNDLSRCAANDSIRGIVLRTHSGGGEVTAAQRLVNAIKEAKKKVPVVQFIDGMSASGAVMAGVTSDYIIAGGRTVEIGSIGVVMQFPKWWVESLQKDIISIYADGSEKKHDLTKAVMNGDVDYVKKFGLNPVRKEFVDHVRRNREITDKEAYTGRMFLAPEAKQLGLIDSIGTMQDALRKVNQLANERRKNSRASSARRALNLV